MVSFALRPTGNFHRLFRDGYDYHDQLVKQYGGALKIYGMLGVCATRKTIRTASQSVPPSQAPNLMTSDPRALHHIVVKEQDVYHETDMFLM